MRSTARLACSLFVRDDVIGGDLHLHMGIHVHSYITYLGYVLLCRIFTDILLGYLLCKEVVYW